MPHRAPTHSEEQGRKAYDLSYTRQGKHQAVRAIYQTTRWRKLRAQVMLEEPLCADPYGWHVEDGRPRRSEQVDHILPLWVSLTLAYSRRNLQGLCTRCHTVKTHEDRRKARENGEGRMEREENEEREGLIAHGRVL